MIDPSLSSHLPVARPAEVRRAAAHLLRQDRRAFVGAVLLNGLAAGLGLVAPWLLGRMVDEIERGAGVSTVDRLALIVLIVAAAQLLVMRYARVVGHRVGERAAARIREQFVDRVLALRASLVERAGTGDLATRGTADVQRVGTAVRDAGPDLLIAVLQFLLLFGAIFLLNPVLGGCAVLGLIGITLAFRWYLRRAHQAYLDAGARTSALAQVLATTAAGARTVEAFGLGQHRLRVCDQAIAEGRRAQLRTLSLRSVLFPTVDISALVPVAVVVVVGGLMHHAGSVSTGTVVSAVLYLGQLTQPLDTILLRVDQVQSGGASFARTEGADVADLRETEAQPSVLDGTLPTVVEPVSGSAAVTLCGVRYAYDDGTDVLHGIDLTVRPGERLAIVGPSGAGKSTVAKLIAGIDHPREGSVTSGGIPVTALDPETERPGLVLITEEQHVFLGTLRDNLRLVAPSVADHALLSALSAVRADWITELPDGLDTQLSEDALDTARTQQLALARVILADPHTVVLDEATALLDPRSARHAERTLAAVLAGRTVIAIAHRLHTSAAADRVAVMEAGRITEIGNHRELIDAGGTYAGLWHRWHGEGGTS